MANLSRLVGDAASPEDRKQNMLDILLPTFQHVSVSVETLRCILSVDLENVFFFNPGAT